MTFAHRVLSVSGGIAFTLLFMVFAAPQSSTQGQSISIPDPQTGKLYFAAFPLTAVLDGDFSEWENIPYADVNAGPAPGPTQQAGSFRFASMADAQNLYFSIQVNDNNIIAGQHGRQYWNEDSIEIYINATGNLGQTTYVPGIVQLTIPAVNIGRSIYATIFGGTDWESICVQAIVVQTENGYAIEAAVPLVTSVWNIPAQAGTIIGFQVQLNGATQMHRDIKLSWSELDTTDQSYLNPSVFGQLVIFSIVPTQPIDLPTGVPVHPTLISTIVSIGITSTPEQSGTIAQTSPSPIPTTLEPTATATPLGRFRVNGSTIYDPNSNAFVARGTNVNGYNWVWSRPTVPDATLIIDCWQFNLVRVNSLLFTGQIGYPQFSVNNDLDAIIREFTERGVVVVLEAHDRIGRYYQGNDRLALIAWFTDLAVRHRDNPYVWFDIANEPGGQNGIDRNNWLWMHREVIRGIRDVAGADNIILVEGAFGGQDAGNRDSSFVTESAILQLGQDILTFNGRTYENIVFSIHPYERWNGGDAKMANYFDQVLARNFAMIVGEYAVRTNVDTVAATDSMFNTTVPRGIGRIVWHWDGSDYNDLTTGTSRGGGWEIDSCVDPTNLSVLGERIWQDNH